MAPLARISVLLAFAALCIHQTGTAVPVKHSNGKHGKAKTEMSSAAHSENVISNSTGTADISTSVAAAAANLTFVSLGASEAVYPAQGGASIKKVPISEADLTSTVSDVAQSIVPAVPAGGIVDVLSQALSTIEAVQSELRGVLGSSAPAPAAAVPVVDTSSASPAEVSPPIDSGAADPAADVPPSNASSTASPEADAFSDSPTSISPPAGSDGYKNIISPLSNNTLVQEPPKTINVTLGDGTTRFTPALVKANPGDTIQFNWVGKNNHSVTETDFLGSCNKSLAEGAFDSGIHPPGTTWSLILPSNARGLKFFYCKVANHCAMGGMSGTIIVPEP